MRTSNPALKAFATPQTWDQFTSGAGARSAGAVDAVPRTMTVRGTAVKLGIMIALAAVSAVFAWGYITQPGNQDSGLTIGIGALLGGLVLGLVITVAPRTAPYLGPVYAVVEGGVLALFSYIITTRAMGTPDTGMVFQAIGLTFALAGGLAIAYGAGLVRVGATATKVIVVAGSGLCLYVVALLLCNGVFGMNLPNLYTSASPLGIGFTVVCLILGSLFLVLDFQFVEAGVAQGAPKHMEWYGAFGILVTLVWLYIEVLRLISKLRSE